MTLGQESSPRGRTSAGIWVLRAPVAAGMPPFTSSQRGGPGLVRQRGPPTTRFARCPLAQSIRRSRTAPKPRPFSSAAVRCGTGQAMPESCCRSGWPGGRLQTDLSHSRLTERRRRPLPFIRRSASRTTASLSRRGARRPGTAVRPRMTSGTQDELELPTASVALADSRWLQQAQTRARQRPTRTATGLRVRVAVRPALAFRSTSGPHRQAARTRPALCHDHFASRAARCRMPWQRQGRKSRSEAHAAGRCAWLRSEFEPPREARGQVTSVVFCS